MNKTMTSIICIAVLLVLKGWAGDEPQVVEVAQAVQVAAVEPSSPSTVVVTPAVAAPSAPVVSTPTVAPSSSPETAEPVVIEYIEADIQNVLRTLAAKASTNLILGDEVTGKVTVHLENISYEDAMQLVIESKGFAYVKEKNVWKVKSRQSLEMEPVAVKIHTLNYAKADDVRKTLEPVLTKQGKIQVDARSNTLVLSDTSSSLAKIVPLIESLDTQTPQVLIEAKFVETTRNPRKDLGINWAPTMLNHDVVAGGSAISEKVGEPPKIIVDEVNKPVSGLQWVKPAGGGAFSPWVAGAALLDVGTAKLVFSYLSQDSGSELLANPRVVTTDNQKAKLSIATQYPIPNFAFSEQTASLQITGFEYKDIGIILNVLPRINKNEFVTLEVTPEVSSSTESTTLESGGGSAVRIPIINTRVAMTTVLIKSGHTLAIGGLMRQDTSDSHTKVPIMGDLPGLGVLFRSKSLSKSKRELLIFLTPSIVNPDAKTGYEQYYNGLPQEELYTNDRWMPKDNAKARRVLGIGAKQSQPSATAQNFSPR